MKQNTKNLLTSIATFTGFIALIAFMLAAISGCMYNRTDTSVWVMGEGNYTTTDAGAQDKPITTSPDLNVGDAAMKAAASLVGGGAGAAVAGPAGAIAGAGAAVLAQDALSVKK